MLANHLKIIKKRKEGKVCFGQGKNYMRRFTI